MFPPLQLQRERNEAVSHQPGPSRWPSGAGHVLDRVRHEAQRGRAPEGGRSRLELVSVPQPGRHRLSRRHSARRRGADTEMLPVLHPQAIRKGDCKEEEGVKQTLQHSLGLIIFYNDVNDGSGILKLCAVYTVYLRALRHIQGEKCNP